MKNKKTAAIMIVSVALMLTVAFAAVFYARGDFDFSFIDRPETTAPAPDTTVGPQETTRDPDPTDDPSVTTAPVPDVPEPEFPDYDAALAGVPYVSDLAGSGKTLYGGLYNGDTCTLARVSVAEGAFPGAYALRDREIRVVNRETGSRGEYIYTETTETKPSPVLTPYFGYVLYDTGTAISLLDSSGRTLVGDISWLTPVGHRDLSGHPLFKDKDGNYYYYYNGVETTPATVVVDRITENDIWQFPIDEYPNIYWSIDDSSELTPTLPDHAGMVACTVNEHYFNDVAIPSSYESRGSDAIFRYCHHMVERTVTNQAAIDARAAEIAAWQAGVAAGTVDPAVTPEPAPVEPEIKENDKGYFWGYIDQNGNYLLDPEYEFVYEFSDDGLAVVSDREAVGSGRIIVIDQTGRVIVNAYKKSYYSAEVGGTKLRDGHYLPDTYGVESTGMLKYDAGCLRVRRRVTESYGRKVQREEDILINTRGEQVNIPGGYRLVAYSDGIALLERNGLYGYMDASGRWIVQPTLTYAAPFSEGLAAAGYSGGHVGMIDRAGNFVLPAVFTYVSQCCDGVVTANSDGREWCVFHKMSAEQYTEPTNPVMTVKYRLLAQAAYDKYIEENGLPNGRVPSVPADGQ